MPLWEGVVEGSSPQSGASGGAPLSGQAHCLPAQQCLYLGQEGQTGRARIPYSTSTTLAIQEHIWKA